MKSRTQIPFHLKVRKTNGEGEVIGKWILRKAFEKFLPGEIVWRRKEETDISRGTDKLSQNVSSRMPDVEFEQISKSKEVRITSREEAYYYKMMR